MSPLSPLADRWTLAGSLVAFVILTAIFAAVQPMVGGTYLDGVVAFDPALSLVGSLSDGQKATHIWMSALADTVYPFAYGLFFAGLAIRYLGKRGTVLAIPALAVIPFDLAENLTHIGALAGSVEALGLKPFLTSMKFGLFFLAAVIALVAICAAIWGRIRRLRQPAA